MITQWSVLSLLRQLTDITDEDEALCLQTCLSALEGVRSRLSPNADPDDVRIAEAAAGAAFYSLCVRRLGKNDGIVSFKAGDISVEKSADTSLQNAAAVRDNAFAALTPLLRDDGFFCCGVDI